MLLHSYGSGPRTNIIYLIIVGGLENPSNSGLPRGQSFVDFSLTQSFLQQNPSSQQAIHYCFIAQTSDLWTAPHEICHQLLGQNPLNDNNNDGHYLGQKPPAIYNLMKDGTICNGRFDDSKRLWEVFYNGSYQIDHLRTSPILTNR